MTNLEKKLWSFGIDTDGTRWRELNHQDVYWLERITKHPEYLFGPDGAIDAANPEGTILTKTR